MRDRTVRLQIDVQEMPPEVMSDLFSLNDKLGYFFFKENFFNEIDTANLPKLVIDENEKSPSTRLRNVLYVLHKQNKGEDHDFDAYYRKSIERVIETIKEKLI